MSFFDLLHNVKKIPHMFNCYINNSKKAPIIFDKNTTAQLTEGLNTFVYNPKQADRLSMDLAAPNHTQTPISLFYRPMIKNNLAKNKSKHGHQYELNIKIENGLISCSNGPAIVCKEKKKTILEIYCMNGLLHRLDGPAINAHIIVYAQNGLFHREDGPAVIANNGQLEIYFKNGNLHRDNEPALLYLLSFIYAQDGKIHRPCNEGPAIYIVETNNYLHHEFKELYIENDLFHNDYGPAVITDDEYSIINMYYKKGLLHNTKGPAYYYKSKNSNKTVKIYAKNGLIHNDDEPAVIYKNTEYWYKNGLLHRENGPAIVNEYKYEYYYMGHLHRDDGPAYISPFLLKWRILGNPNYVNGYETIKIERGYNYGTYYVVGIRDEIRTIIKEFESKGPYETFRGIHPNKKAAMNYLKSCQNITNNGRAQPKLYMKIDD